MHVYRVRREEGQGWSLVTQREGEDRSRKRDREETTEDRGRARGKKARPAAVPSRDHSVEMQQHLVTHAVSCLGAVGVRTISFPICFGDLSKSC